jgi:hypothetical protein
VNAYLASQGQTLPAIASDSSVAIRNDRYKIVQNTTYLYVSQAAPCVNTAQVEFYEINEAVPTPKLDLEGTQLPLGSLTPDQQRNYTQLSTELGALLASASICPGDGNIDSVVNQQDLANWAFYNQTWGLSSVYDFNFDGLTNAADRAVIEQNLGLDCRIR